MSSMRGRRRTDEGSEQRTLREWSSRIERLNSIDSGLMEPRISSAYSKGSLGYAGFYHYLTASDSGRRSKGPSASSEYPHHPKRPTNFERWISVKKPGDRSDRNLTAHESKSPLPISEAEIKEIQRCFQAADAEETGWLDCEGFKQFMSMRGAPITHLDARKLLKAIDHKFQRFISFDQVMYLVVHCGITTDHEVPITSDEFSRILNRMRLSSVEKESKTDIWTHHSHDHHRRPQTVHDSQRQFSQCERDLRPHTSRVVSKNFPMDHSRSFFEEMASDVQIKANEERLYKEYRREVQKYGVDKGRRVEPPADQPEWEGPPAWKNLVLHSQDPNYHVPPIVFKDLHKDWEHKSRSGLESEGTERSNGQGPKVGTNQPLHSACHLKIEGAPKGLPASAFCIPGRPQPFVVTQTELQVQLEKIRKKNECADGALDSPLADDKDELKTDLLFKALTKTNGTESI